MKIIIFIVILNFLFGISVYGQKSSSILFDCSKKNETGIVIIFRPFTSIVGNWTKIYIYVDDSLYVSMKTKSFVVLELKTGKHIITGKQNSNIWEILNKNLQINVESGKYCLIKTYFTVAPEGKNSKKSFFKSNLRIQFKILIEKELRLISKNKFLKKQISKKLLNDFCKKY